MATRKDAALGASVIVALIGLSGTIFQAVWPQLAESVRISLGIESRVYLGADNYGLVDDHQHYTFDFRIVTYGQEIKYVKRTELEDRNIWFALYIGPDTGGIASLPYQVVQGPYALDEARNVTLTVGADLERSYYCDLNKATLIIIAAPRGDVLKPGIVPGNQSDLYLFGPDRVWESAKDKAYCQ